MAHKEKSPKPLTELRNDGCNLGHEEPGKRKTHSGRMRTSISADHLTPVGCA
jgi:hypothetical protein